ncbi:MAG TPA: hypothetical protein DD727_05130 [Clostridiales bacterium]|nr:hypothetical protein [Clostridiales bacterium]
MLVEKPISNRIEEAREMVDFAARRKLYLGCNLNHNFTPTAERAMQYIDDGQIGEQVYCLHKMGFNGGIETYAPANAPRAKRFEYFHTKAFLAHPFAVMRHFCGDITHVQAFFSKPGHRSSARELMLSINSIHVKFASGGIGYLLSHRGDAMFGLGGWWSFELAGTKGTFCIENCIEKLTYWRAPEKGVKYGLGGGPEPEVFDTGIKDFNQTFPRRINAFLEDVTNGVHHEDIRSSGRDALATLEYTFAAMESYEEGGVLVRPNPLPPIHGNPFTVK